MPKTKGNGLAYGVNQWVREELPDQSGLSANQSGTSIFDPVICELAYRWFCPPGGLVLDPFAGGSVRGIVAGCLGRKYLGVDLSGRQIEANKAQAKTICTKAQQPRWIVGDSRNIDKIAKGTQADLLFSCPPYADLEKYSDNPSDLSAMSHVDFKAAYMEIIAKSCALLKPDRFACFVIGDARDKDGFYYGLPWLTHAAFEAAGLRLYNSAILVTACGSLAIRVMRQFTVSRKLGTTHQHVMIWCKGDPVAATRAIGDVEVGDIIEDEGATGAPAQPSILGTAAGGGPLASQFGEIL